MILYHNYNHKRVDDTNLVQSLKPLLFGENMRLVALCILGNDVRVLTSGKVTT